MDWQLFFHNTYKFYPFLLGQEIADSQKLTDGAVLFCNPITTGKHPVEKVDRRYGTWAAVNCLNLIGLQPANHQVQSYWAGMVTNVIG